VCIAVDNAVAKTNYFFQILEHYRCIYGDSIPDYLKRNVSEKGGAELPILIINIK
jgi:hypothetical protein